MFKYDLQEVNKIAVCQSYFNSYNFNWKPSSRVVKVYIFLFFILLTILVFFKVHVKFITRKKILLYIFSKLFFCWKVYIESFKIINKYLLWVLISYRFLKIFNSANLLIFTITGFVSHFFVYCKFSRVLPIELKFFYVCLSLNFSFDFFSIFYCFCCEL